MASGTTDMAMESGGKVYPLPCHRSSAPLRHDRPLAQCMITFMKDTDTAFWPEKENSVWQQKTNYLSTFDWSFNKVIKMSSQDQWESSTANYKIPSSWVNERKTKNAIKETFPWLLCPSPGQLLGFNDSMVLARSFLLFAENYHVGEKVMLPKLRRTRNLESGQPLTTSHLLSPLLRSNFVNCFVAEMKSW